MRVIVSMLFVVACGRGAEPASTGAAPAIDPARWTCTVDADCMNSCAHGAVNAAWYAAAKLEECEDGCADVEAEPPRCIEGGCVAFWEPPGATAPTRNERCTRKR